MTQIEKQKLKENLNNKPASIRKRKLLLSLPVINKAFVILIIISAVYYIISVNDLAIKGFVLEESKAKLVELNNHNKELELKAMNLQTYENIVKRAEDLKMVSVEKIDYLTVIGGGVAVK